MQNGLQIHLRAVLLSGVGVGVPPAAGAVTVDARGISGRAARGSHLLAFGASATGAHHRGVNHRGAVVQGNRVAARGTWVHKLQGFPRPSKPRDLSSVFNHDQKLEFGCIAPQKISSPDPHRKRPSAWCGVA